MKIQARQSILEMWRSTVEYSFDAGEWQWGGRRGRNCVSDAEQLLTLLYPATVIPSLRMERIDETSDDVLDAMSGLGGGSDVPRTVLQGVAEYLRTYRDEDGNPLFSGGSYFQVAEDQDPDVAARQRELDVVDAYSMSITLALAALGFSRVFRQGVRSERLLQELQDLERLASRRLTAAMVGLLRSFNVHTFDADSEAGRSLLMMLNQHGGPRSQLLEDLRNDPALSEIRVGLREELGPLDPRIVEELDNPSRLFECGWSWGIIDGAPEVEDVKHVVPLQVPGVAEARPYTYFTVTALDGIADLFSERTRILGLLDESQQGLARALQLRWDMTQRFWMTMATYGDARWPLEDVPWRTSDGLESDYHTLLLSALVIQGLREERNTDPALRRAAALLEELAGRARITRRPLVNDPGVALHVPGMYMRLLGSEKLGGPSLEWVVTSFSTLLLKQVVQVAGALGDTDTRVGLLNLADAIWDHLQRRRLPRSGGLGRERWDLWDRPTDLYDVPEGEEHDKPSWYHTERTMESLVAAANAVEEEPLPPNEISRFARQVLAEAEHLFDQELLRGTEDVSATMRDMFQVVEAHLTRARTLLRTRPATAVTLAQDVLRKLDELSAARQGMTRMG